MRLKICCCGSSSAEETVNSPLTSPSPVGDASTVQADRKGGGDISRAADAGAAEQTLPTVVPVPPQQPLPSSPSRRYARDSAKDLGTSLHEAWENLAADSPDAVEENEVRRAIELSLLDCALVYRDSSRAGGAALAGRPNGDHRNADSAMVTMTPPHVVLGVGPEATPEEIKAAFRRRALETHPDKGGVAGEFETVALAYRTLLSANAASRRNVVAEDRGGIGVANGVSINALKTTAHWDAELKGHHDLVSEMFANDCGADIADNAARQLKVRTKLGLRHKEAGASNVNERNERIRNSCFYLSLAVSYLSGIGALMCPAFGPSVNDGSDEALRAADDALISQTALQLKRTIEGAVIAAHPEWATQGMVGEEVQAFSDFLVFTLDSDKILSDWAVAIFDETSGFVDVYKGRNYGSGRHDGNSEDDWARRANTLTLRFVPGHYQPLLPVDVDRRTSLDDILASLDHEGVFYVVTDGAA